MGLFLGSHVGQTFLSGNWGWFGIIVVLQVFNTVLGAELLFRGLLLPRMNGRFGRWDWLANGVLFAVYHLHVPWVIPQALLDTFIVAYPRSALCTDRTCRPGARGVDGVQTVDDPGPGVGAGPG